MRKIYTLLIIWTFVGCTNNENILNSTFTKDEINTINQIISFYDDFVYDNTDKSLTIENAYKTFLDKNVPMVYKQGNINLLIPDSSSLLNLYQTLNRNDLNVFFTIQDTVSIYHEKTQERKQEYHPFTFHLNYSGKYIQMLEKLSSRSEYFESYYSSLLNAFSGTGNPGSMNLILSGYNNIDFSKKEERLIFIITMLEYETDNVINKSSI